MEIRLPIVVICFVLAALKVDISDAVKCYSCGSLSTADKNCEDPFSTDGKATTTCGAGCQKRKLESNGNQYVERGCAPASADECSKASVPGGEADVCICKGELCNTANTQKVSMGLLMVILMGRIIHRWIN